MIDLAALESLRAVAHHASVNGAAQALGFTPSAVSQQVKRLERGVGVPLLERVGRGVVLTAAGQRLVRDTGELRERLERIEAELRLAAGEVAGSLHVATFSTATRGLVAPVLRRLREERDEGEVRRALAALTEAAGRESKADEGLTNNLLAAAVDAARAKATVGEISDAMERVFGRHVAEIRTISGVYRHEVGDQSNVEQVRALVEKFAENDGRRPRILVAKIGQDGHDRGQKVIATAFADLGFDVDVGPLFQTPAEVAVQAVEADVHVVGVSSLAAGHLTLVPALREELARLDREDIMIVVGGVIPPGDFEELRAAGASAIFPPGTVIAEAAIDLLDQLEERLDPEGAGRRG